MGLGATEVVFWWQYITVFTFFKHTSSLLKKGYMMEDKQIGVPTNVAVFIDYENVYKAQTSASQVNTHIMNSNMY